MMPPEMHAAAPLLSVIILTLVVFIGAPDVSRANFPGANGLIAYTRYFSSPSLGCDVYTVDPETSTVSSLTNTTECEVGPAWSPDGSRIAVSRDGLLWMMNADGSNAHPVGSNVSAYDPAWSPDGNWIAYESAAEGGSLFVIGADGGNPFRVASAGGYAVDGGPSWSPDCKRIAFTDGDLWVVNPDGTGLERLGSGNAPSWSPDGRYIAFNAHPDLSVINVATREVTNLSTGSQLVGEIPAWSPDGTQIAFTSRALTPETQNIFVMRADGTGVRQLTDHDQGEQWADWQPLPGGRALAACDFVFSMPSPGSETAQASPAVLPEGGGPPPKEGNDWLAVGTVALAGSLAAAIVLRGRSLLRAR